MAKDPNLAKVDRSQIIDALKKEGVLEDIINSLQLPKARTQPKPAIDASLSMSGEAPSAAQKKVDRRGLKPMDPNKRYLSCNISHGKAFVDFVSPREDELISVAVSFLKSRFHTKKVRAGVEFSFNETFVFELEGDQESAKIDAALLLKLKLPIHLTILRHRAN